MDDLPRVLLLAQGASDGWHLEDYNVGSYGWVIGTKETTFFECFGPSYHSSHGNSYRAEATGMLSLSVFLYCAAKYLQTTLETFHVHCDNKGLVNKLHKFQHTTEHPHPLSAEWDLLIELSHIWTSAEFQKIRIHHVKGHPEKRKPREEWTLAETLNVYADGLAAQGREDADESDSSDGSSVWSQHHALAIPRDHAPLLSHTMVQLHSSQGTLTAKYKPRTHYCRTHQAYFDYLRYRWGWSQEVLTIVDLTAHRTAHSP